MDHHRQQSGHLFFDPAACHGNTLFLGGDNPVFQGQGSLLSMEDASSKKRPFFSTSADFYDDEYYDEQLPEKKRRLTAEQVNLLEKSFEAENKLEPERKTELAKMLGLQPRQVAVWFQNRRARCKTKQLERDYDLLKASYDSLRSNYDSAVKENDRLKYEVVSLTEKLEAKEITLAQAENPCTLPTEATANLLGHEVVNVKAEDRVSTGSAGSAVVDEDSHQLADSGDSYFLANDYPGGVLPGEAMLSEEDERSDDGGGYFTNVFMDQEEEGRLWDGGFGPRLTSWL